MRTYVIQRILLAIPSLLLVAIAIFSMVRLMPGDVLDARFAEGMGASPELVAEMRREMGLDKPFHEQLVKFFADMLRGDLGKSLLNGKSVVERLVARIPVTLELGMLAFITGTIIALPVGIVSALRQDTWMDYAGRLIAIGLLSIPGFVLASVVVIFPAIWWKWAPPSGYASWWVDPGKHFQQMLLAAVVLGAHSSGLSMRMIRSSLLEVIREDYIRTAWAKGLTERAVILKHALKPAFIPVVTVWGSQIGYLLGGTVIIESIFGLPGVGLLTLQSVTLRDYTQVQSQVLFFAVGFVVVNLAVDSFYGWLDPRVRY